MKYERHFFRGANCSLSAIDYERPARDPDPRDVVIVHGMRDHALSMTSLAHAFGQDYHVVVPDLRGHGDSDNPGSYTMVQFVADLRALILHFGLKNPVLIGHSLGGHITSKYAALYADEVSALVLIDGMGPPRGQQVRTDAQLQAMWRSQIDGALQQSSDRRPLTDQHEALSRLARNNPRLAAETARQIVEHGVEPHPEGGVRWKWDPMVNMVWSTFDHRESEQQWGFVLCPVLIVTGEESMSYWTGRNFETPPGDVDELHRAETERRRKLFRQAHHVEIAEAGHMIHYDQPAVLNQRIREFLDASGR